MRILHACVRILHVCGCILVPRNLDLGFLQFYLFCFALILCLGLVKSSFHIFSFKVSRITCFSLFNYKIDN